MFKGIFTPIITAFTEEGIDYGIQAVLVERLIAAGVDGILFGGSIGEFQAMTPDEKKVFFQWAVTAVAGRVKVLAGTGGTCVQEAVELTDSARQAGVDGAVVISPFYFKLTEEDLYRYYSSIASVGLPILLYNFPDRTNISLSAALVRRLAIEKPTIVGIKDTVDTISHTREVIAAVKPVRPDFSILSGFDEYLLPNLMAGGDGILTGMTNVYPELFVSMMSAWKASDFAFLRQGQWKINRLMELYGMASPFIAAIKCAMAFVVPGVPEKLRAPFGTVTDTQRQDIHNLLVQTGLLPPSDRWNSVASVS